MVARIQRFILDNRLPTVISSYHPLRDEVAGSPGRPGRRAKAARIEAMEPRFRNRKIWLHRGTCEALYDQYKNWPDIEHDDVLDSLAMHYGLARPCEYRSLEEAEAQFLQEDDTEEPGDIFAEYRRGSERGRVIGQTGLSSQRLAG